MNEQTTPDIEKAAACLSVNHKGYEVQWLPSVVKYRVVALKGKYYKAVVTEITAKEYYEGTNLKESDRN